MKNTIRLTALSAAGGVALALLLGGTPASAATPNASMSQRAQIGTAVSVTKPKPLTRAQAVALAAHESKLAAAQAGAARAIADRLSDQAWSAGEWASHPGSAILGTEATARAIYAKYVTTLEFPSLADVGAWSFPAATVKAIKTDWLVAASRAKKDAADATAAADLAKRYAEAAKATKRTDRARAYAAAAQREESNAEAWHVLAGTRANIAATAAARQRVDAAVAADNQQLAVVKSLALAQWKTRTVNTDPMTKAWAMLGAEVSMEQSLGSTAGQYARRAAGVVPNAQKVANQTAAALKKLAHASGSARAELKKQNQAAASLVKWTTNSATAGRTADSTSGLHTWAVAWNPLASINATRAHTTDACAGSGCPVTGAAYAPVTRAASGDTGWADASACVLVTATTPGATCPALRGTVATRVRTVQGQIGLLYSPSAAAPITPSYVSPGTLDSTSVAWAAVVSELGNGTGAVIYLSDAE